ncbi:MAG: phospholipase D-like domain-containing protein [Ferruginibacter sp.]
MPGRKKRKAAVYTNLNKTELIRGGRMYFDTLLKLIDEAKEIIHVQVYIFSNDETGTAITDALKNAVKRKVAVYLLADGYASQSLPGAFIKDIETAGIHFRFFEPLLKSRHFYFGRRMHHKVVVVDNKYALVGGLNITNRYNDMPGQPAWLDFALHVEGEIVSQLCSLCWKTWKGFQSNTEIPNCGPAQISLSIPEEYKCAVRMRRNDWVRRKNEISGSYIELLRTSKQQVTILSSYFLPGQIIRRQIAFAAKRGVKIRVITTGASDVAVSKMAERWLYDWLLRRGVEIYEYEKTILHGKIAVCDDQWITAGSYNINNLSAYASIELNLDVKNPMFAKTVSETLDDIIRNDCLRITPEEHLKRKNIFKQFGRWLSYNALRLILYIFTFYYRHQKD